VRANYGRDLIRHGRTGQQGSHLSEGESNGPAQTRIRELQTRINELTVYERIVAKLRPLLSDDVYERFAEAIRHRLEAKETLETHLVAIKAAEIDEAEINGRTAFITVKFVSDQINVTRAADGKILDGEPDHVAEKTDFWTFARNTRSQDPNWLLVATRSA